MWTIVYIHDEAPRGWHVIDVTKLLNGFPSVLNGPYNSHAEAQEAIATRSHRLAQGWKP